MHLIVLMKKTKSFQILSLSLFFFLSSIAFRLYPQFKTIKSRILFGMHSIDVLMKKKKKKTKNKSFSNSPFIFLFIFLFSSLTFYLYSNVIL
jgi:hypothetical protein